ncbi:prenylated Rab acceptor [Aphelenchoides avenae]|nr:prenylated Rab acceptor [Aphelenchus avenae]
MLTASISGPFLSDAKAMSGPPPPYSPPAPTTATSQQPAPTAEKVSLEGNINANPAMPAPNSSSWFPSANILPENGESGPGAAQAAQWFSDRRQTLRAWSEFFRCAKFGLPPSLTAVVPRIKNNLQYFLSNYMCVFIVLMVYCILTSFLMLLTLIALGGLFYTIRQRTAKGPVVFGGHEIPPSLMYTAAIMICIPFFALADVGAVMYWVIGSSIFVILAHATLYASEEVPGSEFEVVTVVTA